MPIMPGGSSGAGAGSGLTSTDPSDASGLLNDTDPFSGDSPLTSDDLGSLSGAAPGLTSADGGETMPMMPGMGSGAGAGAASGLTDPSDASGLLSDTDPFTGDSPLTSDDLGSVSGAAPGLTSADEGEGMPFMPGTGSGAGAGQALSSTDPSDASGLLSDTDPFTGDSPLTSDELGSESGTAPGLTAAADGEGMPFMPGMGSGSGAGQALGVTDPSDASGLLSDTDPFTGDSPLTSDELGSETGTAPGLTAAADGEGMPFMPGMGSGSGAGQALGATDPSDASGLLGKDGEPWAEEEVPGEGEVGSLSGAVPGESVGADGMPFMPGMGSGSGAGQALGATDPSDASGLLGEDGEPWAEPETTAGDEIGSADGAQAAAAESEPAEEMPMMPGTGAGQAASQQGDERSDASGLLAAQTQPWTGGDEEHSEEVGASNGAAAAVGETALGAAAAAALLGAGAALAAAAPAEQEQAIAEQSPVEEAALAEPVAAAEEEYEYDDGFDEEEDGAGHEHDANRVPVIGADASDDDLSGWDLAGAAADAALFTLGAWANRRRRGEDETFARTVSTEQDAWLGEDADLPDAGEEADALPTAGTWRPNRDFSGSGESRLMAGGGTMMRSAMPPKDYDPVAAAEAAAAAAEAEEAERQAALEAEEEEKRKRAPADLLTQDPDMWGSPKTDWDAL
jgi:hypothetical protein